MRLFTILRILFIFPVSMELFPLFGNSKNKECNVCKNLLNFPRTAVIITDFFQYRLTKRFMFIIFCVKNTIVFLLNHDILTQRATSEIKHQQGGCMKSAILLCMAALAVEAAPILDLNFDAGSKFYGEQKTVQTGNAPVVSNGLRENALKTGFQNGEFLSSTCNMPSVIPTDSGSIIFWVKPLDWTGKDPGFKFMIRSAEKDRLFIIYKYYKDNFLTWYWKEGKQVQQLRFNIAKWKKNEWHQVAAVWNQDELKFFLNGKRMVKVKRTVFASAPYDSVSLGSGWRNETKDYTMLMDEVQIYTEALSDTAIQNEYQKFAKFVSRDDAPITYSAFPRKAVLDGRINPREYSSESRFFF